MGEIKLGCIYLIGVADIRVNIKHKFPILVSFVSCVAAHNKKEDITIITAIYVLYSRNNKQTKKEIHVEESLYKMDQYGIVFGGQTSL